MVNDDGRPSCRVCGQNTYREDSNANMYCTNCGTILTAFRREELDFEDSAHFGHGTRYRSKMDLSEAGTSEERTFRVTSIFFEAFQELLRIQCVALVLEFGCAPALVAVVGRLWTVFLDQQLEQFADMRVRISSRRLLKRNATESLTVRRTRARRRPRHAAIDANGNALAPEPSRPVVAEEEEEEDIDDDMHESGQESDQEDQEVDQEEDQVAAEEAVDRMPDYFPLHASLSLLLCATTLLLEPVSAADLVAWAQRGSGSRLPLLGALADFSPSVRDRVEAHSDLVSYFSPRRIWHVKHVRQHAARVFAPLIQNRLRIDMGPRLRDSHALPLFIARFGASLRLPAGVCLLATQLGACWQSVVGRLPPLSRYSMADRAVGVLLVALQLCYGLTDDLVPLLEAPFSSTTTSPTSTSSSSSSASAFSWPENSPVLPPPLDCYPLPPLPRLLLLLLASPPTTNASKTSAASSQRALLARVTHTHQLQASRESALAAAIAALRQAHSSDVDAVHGAELPASIPRGAEPPTMAAATAATANERSESLAAWLRAPWKGAVVYYRGHWDRRLRRDALYDAVAARLGAEAHVCVHETDVAGYVHRCAADVLIKCAALDKSDAEDEEHAMECESEAIETEAIEEEMSDHGDTEDRLT